MANPASDELVASIAADVEHGRIDDWMPEFVREVIPALLARLEAAEAERERLAAVVAEMRKVYVLIAALEFYANPAVYAPHPHGPAFDRRDISFKAKNALAEFRGNDELPPNFAACCNSTDLAACDCVEKMHIRVLFSRGGKRKYQPIGDPL